MHFFDSDREQLVLCAEALERRCLLSAGPAPSDSDAGEKLVPPHIDAETASERSSLGALRVLELESAEEEDDAQNVAIALSDLPSAVLAAITRRFPYAELTEAEFSSEDGEDEFDVGATFGGRMFEVTITPRGRILETEAVLTKQELPPETLTWLREEFPGARIDEAAIMTEDGETSYELTITDSDGESYEAVLRLPNTPPVTIGPTEADGGAEVVAEAADTPLASPALVADALPDAQPAATPRDVLQTQASVVVGDPETPDQQLRTAAETGSSELTSEETGSDGRDAQATDSPAREPDLIDDLLYALAIAGVPMVWMPELAGMLTDVLPVDAATVERELLELLDELESIAQSVASESATVSVTWRLAAVVALIAGAQLLRTDLKNPVARLCWSLSRATPLRPRGSRRDGSTNLSTGTWQR